MATVDAAETAAKAAWEALKPEEGTIEWYHRWFAEHGAYAGEKGNPEYYQRLLAWFADYNTQRIAFGDDDGWLSGLREQYDSCPQG